MPAGVLDLVFWGRAEISSRLIKHYALRLCSFVARAKPALVINPVKSLDNALTGVNTGPRNLARFALANRADRIDRMIDEVKVGNFSANTLEATMPETPFGGVKSSG